MVYAYDQNIQLPVRDLYDTQMMLASIQTAKDMYEKGQQELKDFNKQYGDFMSPFSKDMQRYNEMVGGVKNIINQLYANGIDPLRSPEGRAAVSRAIQSINPAEYNAMRTNAKLGYAYLDAMQKLRQSGKYSEAQELFDIANSNGTQFSDFSTAGTNGTFNTWDRVSPIEATTLRDLTYKSYEHRTPRDLTADDFKNDPRLAKYKMDPRYQYTGYLDSDLMKVAPGASASLVGDPRAAFFRDQARQKVKASGRPVTDEAVEAQFQRDIADANAWALVDPIKKVDEYAKMDYEQRQRMALENVRYNHDLDVARTKALGTKTDTRYSASLNTVLDSEGSLRDLLSNFTDNSTNMELQTRENNILNKIDDISKNPKKYSKEELQSYIRQYNDLSNQREIAGLKGVAKSINDIAKRSSWSIFTNQPERINNILRDLSGTGSYNILTSFLRNLGGIPSSDGGTNVDKKRLCGVGEVMADVLSRGVSDKTDKEIQSAIEQLTTGNLKKYSKQWTAGSFDLRNATDDWWIGNSGNSEFWPTGNVVSGNRYYYIEVANDPNDRDECCWFKVERDVAKGGGINKTLSNITQVIDSEFMHEYSSSNVIGNEQSAVKEYNN